MITGEIMAQRNTAVTETPAEKKTVKIKINSTLRGSYGAFDPGETVEVEKSLADAFIKNGYAQKAD